ncbi:hypothetical protein ONS95_007152 [Cadophora gregata]|uniref:uncharacterized protein n=1 Tax=Cadophora gregata TaxID=51156 RepID=UPI0026DC6C28|nr:uncharacterized protein ONS95_007152 [Cadophora gregata]KAK0100700.1 hypothetical protein ONS95_007152 [Cadophora gregata]KAK0117303.1 hypothetical protein ONS96_013135 [Cadophora gregata f. sp. sojae]
MSSPSLLDLLKNDAAFIGSPILSSSPVSEILSPRPVRRVSFDALVRLAAAFEPAPITTPTTTTTTVTSALAANKRAIGRNRKLLSGSTPEYKGLGGKFGVIGGVRGVGVVGGERG